MSEQWEVHAVDGGHVRLRSGRIGLVSIDATAPVVGGALNLSDGAVTFTLRLSLEKLKTGNFLLQAAARSLVTSNNAHELDYEGSGAPTDSGWSVAGAAVGGSIEVPLALDITAIGPSATPMAEIDIVGSAQVGRVHIPLPGLGTVDDFGFDVEARLAMQRLEDRR